MYRIYTDIEWIPVEIQSVIIEDSNSGFEFFAAVAKDLKIECESAQGKKKLYLFKSQEMILSRLSR